MGQGFNEVIAAVLFAFSTIVAAIAAFKADFLKRANALYIAVAAAAAGFFALVAEAALKAVK